MVACSFNMQFTFVLAGWEDNIHDTRIFLEVIDNPTINFSKSPQGKYMTIMNCYLNLKFVYSIFFIKFVIIFLLVIVGKYYLVHARYPNEYEYLSPYKGARYHFQDFRRRGQPTSRKERFNRAHSPLRNVIERAFEV